MTSEITISEELRHFVDEHANDYHALQIILFFADHPYARFSELTIIHALNHDRSGERCIQEALRKLVDKRMMKMSTESKVAFYSLSENTSVRSPVLELAKLDVRQRQIFLRQICPNSAGRIGIRLFQHMAAEALPERANTTVASRRSSAIFDQEKYQSHGSMPLAYSKISQESANAAY